jgi:hypothetical protein
MSTTSWQVKGDYFESCNCAYLCPCIGSNLAATPTNGHCDVAMVFHVDEGRYGDVDLNGLSFAVVMHAPEAMGNGNIGVGLITDERANQAQTEALAAIATGQGGGPMAALGPLVGSMLGHESKPIHFEKDGLSRSVSIPGVLDEAIQAVPGANPEEPLYLDNTIHPANRRLALAKAIRSHLSVFGLKWDDTSGQNNGHFAPFDWQG